MPVPMHGNRMYATVQERLVAAHGADARPAGIVRISTEPLSLGSAMGAVMVIRATVEFVDGRTFSGISEAQFDATSGAEKTNPVEVAETSAVGRALAMAGYYGSEDGIAGAEEVRQAQRRQGQERQYTREPDLAPRPSGHNPDNQPPYAGPRPAAGNQERRVLPVPGEPPGEMPSGSGRTVQAGGAPATPKQIETVERMSRAAGQPVATSGLTRAQASEIISGLIGSMPDRREA